MLQPETEETKKDTLMDIGAAAFVSVRVHSLDEIFVSIGLGYHLEMNRAEALDYLKKRMSSREQKIEEISQSIAAVRVEIQDSVFEMQKLQLESQ